MQYRPRLAVIWSNFARYHLARLSALAPIGECTGIELASFQRLSGWQADRTGSPVPIRTLATGAVEDLSPHLLARRLWRALSDIRPDAVLVPGYASMPAVTAALWARRHRVLCILMSESNASDHIRHPVRESLKRLLVHSLFDGAVVGGRRAAAYAEALGLPRSAVVRGYDVVDNEFYASGVRECRQRPRPESITPYFLFIGRLAPEKNVAGLIGAFHSYRRQGGTWELVLVGDGDLRGELEARVNALKLGHSVRFAGSQNSAGVVRYLAWAGCLVLPSTREPWGLVVNEAMAAGLPVLVSSRCGCSEDLVTHGVNGFTFDPCRNDELPVFLHRIAALPEARRAAMGEASRATIARYSPEIWADQVQHLLHTSAASARSH